MSNCSKNNKTADIEIEDDDIDDGIDIMLTDHFIASELEKMLVKDETMFKEEIINRYNMNFSSSVFKVAAYHETVVEEHSKYAEEIKRMPKDITALKIFNTEALDKLETDSRLARLIEKFNQLIDGNLRFRKWYWDVNNNNNGGIPDEFSNADTDNPYPVIDRYMLLF